MGGLTEFGAKCREHRIRSARKLYDQSSVLRLSAAQISSIELGEVAIPPDFPKQFSDWLGLTDGEHRELESLASTKSNVISFRPKDNNSENARKLFRKINKLTLAEIRGIGRTLKGNKTDDG
jgi:hypothetical protein